VYIVVYIDCTYITPERIIRNTDNRKLIHTAATAEIARGRGYYAVQGDSRSLVLVGSESPYET